MKMLNLLIIEDEEAQLQVYDDAIEQFNKRNEVQINQQICKNFNEGEKALLSPNYDAAIIDLKLSTTEELEGRKLVESVYCKIRIPIFIVSGSISQIDDIPENALLKKKLRTELMSEILIEIHNIFKTGITSLLRPGGLIDQKLTEIFWRNLSKDLGAWIEHNNSNSLLRYILSYFQEYLEINSDGDFEEYYQLEVYLAPPIKKNLHTGDLVKYENEYYLVITPACDMVVQRYDRQPDGTKLPIRKADNIILIKAKEFDYKNLCKGGNGLLNKGEIKKYITNALFRYHYLPPFEKNTGFLIDFQDLVTIRFSDTIERIASISSPFSKDIISRFSNYYSRQGQPTFQQNLLVEELFTREN